MFSRPVLKFGVSSQENVAVDRVDLANLLSIKSLSYVTMPRDMYLTVVNPVVRTHANSL